MSDEKYYLIKRLTGLWMRGVYIEMIPLFMCVFLLYAGRVFNLLWISMASIICVVVGSYTMIKGIYVSPIKQFTSKYGAVEPMGVETDLFWTKVGSNIAKYPKLFSDRECGLL